ncbi:MAG TPA: hypothetical protein VK892_06235, partial [Pyrinomonadaceae bacterium]|nr:hypothetical protein [Pyrinomonadaceae bacterium]
LPLVYPTNEEGISNLKRSVFPVLFPILLDSSDCFPYNFSYIGVAESKDGRANMIEAVSSDNITYRLFFDEKTNLLLLLTKTWINKANVKRELKYFYSNYKNIEGLQIASTVKIEDGGKLIQTQEIKSLKINPTFKANFFNVKKK